MYLLTERSVSIGPLSPYNFPEGGDNGTGSIYVITSHETILFQTLTEDNGQGLN